MADSRVAWRVSTLLGTVAVLFACVMTVSTTPVSAAGESYNLIVAINGSTYIYSQLMDKSLLANGPLESDFEAATAGIADIANVQVQLNNTAMYVTYVATPHDGHTVDEVSKSIYASTLPSTNTALQKSKAAFLGQDENTILAGFYPANVHPFTPLLPSTGTTPAPVYVETVQSSHTVYLSGDDVVWSKVVTTSADKLKAALVTAALGDVRDSDMTVTCVVDSLAARPADSTRTQPGDTRSGLTAHVTVTQRLTKETRHSYTGLDITSILYTMNVSAIAALYAVSDDALEDTVVTVVAVTFDTKRPDEPLLTTVQLGMVIMGAAIVALMLLAFLCFLIVGCCCWRRCCGSRLARETEGKQRQGLSPLHGYVFDTTAPTQSVSPQIDDAGTPAHACYVRKP